MAYTKSFGSGDSQNKNNGKVSKSKNSKEQIFSPQLMGSLGLIAGLIIAYPPISADSKFQTALKSSQLPNIEAALSPSYTSPRDTFRLLNAVQIFEQNQLFDLSYKYAKTAVQFNPESFDVWRVLYSVKNSTAEEKVQAKQKMIELDPLNKEWKNLP